MGAETEVAVELRVDDHSGGTLEKLKHSFERVEHSVNHVRDHMLGFAKQTASTALGVQLAGIIPTLEGIGHAAIEAAMAAGKEEKSIAASLMLKDRDNRSYQQLRTEATGLREELRAMGMDAGISGESMIESFNDISARTNRSTEAVKEMMGQMAQAARIVPGGLSSITQGFEQIEMGIVRARNPVVLMIASSGLLKGNAKAVAKEMQKMAPEKQMELAEKAIGRMADKMKNVPMSFGEALTSLKDMREEVFDLVGKPIFKGISPMLQNMREEFKAHREDIEHWANAVGEKAGGLVKSAGAEVKEAFAYIGKNWEQIAHTMETIGGGMLSVGKFLADHADVLGRAASFGAAPLANVASGNAGHKTGWGVFGDVAGAAAAGGMVGGAHGALVGGALGAVGAFTEELVAGTEDTLMFFDVIDRGTAAVKKMTAAAEAQAATGKMLESQFAAMQGLTHMAGFKLAGEKGRFGSEALPAVPAAGFEQIAKSKSGMEVMDPETQKQVDAMVMSFNASIAGGVGSMSEGTKSQVEFLVANSQQLQYALVNSSVQVGAGFNDLVDAMVAGGKMTASAGQQAKELVAHKGAKGLAGMAPHVSVGGGNTVNVKQEFKEADPDRVLVAMKAGITRAATARLSAKVSGPFGGF